MSVKTEYSKDELSQLTQSAKNLLGWQIVFHDLHIPGDAKAGIPSGVLDTRGKVAIAISQIELYPTQSPNWQDKVEVNRLTGQKVSRQPMQIYSDFSNANPLVSAVLQRGPRAKSDPLAVIKRVIAAFGKGDVNEVTWNKLLTDKKLGLQPSQLKSLMDSMNFAPLFDAASPVQLRRIEGVAAFDGESREVPDSAHKDLQSKMHLTDAAKDGVSNLLLSILKQEKA